MNAVKNRPSIKLKIELISRSIRPTKNSESNQVPIFIDGSRMNDITNEVMIEMMNSIFINFIE